MRFRGLLAALLAASLLLCACGGEAAERERGDYVLYFLAEIDGTAHGPALDWENYPAGEEPPGPGELLAALLAGPTREGLTSPFPKGVTLRQWSWEEDSPGVLQVSLSEQYGALADVSLTLADYCLTLTLSQLEGVEQVEVISGGYSASYRSHQLLSADEAVLWDELLAGDSEIP